MSFNNLTSTFANDLTPHGKVEKLKMTAFSKNTFAKGDEVGSFSVPFNPTSLSLKLQINRTEDQSNNSIIKYSHIPAQDFGFDFIIDATGFEGGKDAIANASEVIGEKKDKHTYITKKIEELKKILYNINGEIHQPNYVQIVYGSVLLNCALNSLDISYTLFDKSGAPLRAKVTLGFKTVINERKADIVEAKSSPDLTHIRELKQHDHFLNMSNKMYENNYLYVQVARANNMNSIRENKTGNRVVFPPIIEQENSSI
jgi:Contractile injection system tube protein